MSKNYLFENRCKCCVEEITNWGSNSIQMSFLIKNEYKYNSNFRKYVDEYCANNGCALEDAFKDDQIKRKFWMCTEV